MFLCTGNTSWKLISSPFVNTKLHFFFSTAFIVLLKSTPSPPYTLLHFILHHFLVLILHFCLPILNPLPLLLLYTSSTSSLFSLCSGGPWRRRPAGVGPAELLSPGVVMTGSQPDGTEQVFGTWPPLWRGGAAERGTGGIRKRRGGDVKWYISSSRSVSGAEAVIHHKSIIFPCTFIWAVTLHVKRRHFQRWVSF